MTVSCRAASTPLAHHPIFELLGVLHQDISTDYNIKIVDKFQMKYRKDRCVGKESVWQPININKQI
jgi:hypothetical protein